MLRTMVALSLPSWMAETMSAVVYGMPRHDCLSHALL